MKIVKTVINKKGEEKIFDVNKIHIAIRKSADRILVTLSDSDCTKISEEVINMIDTEKIKVSKLHNIVEQALEKTGFNKVADSYRQYRNYKLDLQKTKEIANNDIQATFMSIINAVNNDITRENANMNSDSPAGMMMKFASESTKPFVSKYLLSEDVLLAESLNYLHIHDKDYYPTKSLTCIQHPLDRILEKGFKAGHGEARGAKRIETASILAAISMETVQNEMHGGQAIPAFDFYMAPYVRKTFNEEILKIKNFMFNSNINWENLMNIELKDYIKKPLTNCKNLSEKITQHAINNTVDRVHQAMESFIHNMNSIHSRGGNQVVFSSINYGTDTSAEGRCIIRELLLSTEQGVGNNATAIFPIQIWKTKEGVSILPTDPNYDLYKLACKVSARRFFPNFLNLDATFNKDDAWDINDPKRYEHEVATMGCRTRVYENAFGPKTSIGRGNISFSTMNLVKLAIEVSIQDEFLYQENNNWKFDENKNSVEDKNRRLEAFLIKLSNLVTITTKQLHQRFEFQKTALKKQFPLLMQGLWNGSESLKDTDTIESVINAGTLGVGFIGLAETLVALTGSHHGESEESQKFGLIIIKNIKDQCVEAREKYKHNYACLATPAEGLSGKFTKIDKKEFGIIPGVTDKEYYTNSNHVPVEYKCSIEHKFKIEGPYHELTTAGHIGYCEIDGDLTKNPEAIMDIVQLGRKYNMGYISINHTQLRCPYCNYESNENLNITECPHDHHKLDILQRITGYLVGSTDRWNSGKLDELHRRINHNLYENTSNNS